MSSGLQYVNDPFDGPDGTAPNTTIWTQTINADTIQNIENSRLYFYSDQTALLSNFSTLRSNYRLRGACEVTVDVGILNWVYPTDASETNHYFGLELYADSSARATIAITANDSQRIFFMISDPNVPGFEYEYQPGLLSGTLTLGRESDGSVYGIFPGQTVKRTISTLSTLDDVHVVLYARQRDKKLWEGYHNTFIKNFGEVIWPDDSIYTDLEYAIIDDWKSDGDYSKAYLPENDRYFQATENGALVRNQHRVTKYGRTYQARFKTSNKCRFYGYQVGVESEYDD